VPPPDAYRLKKARGLERRRRGIPLPARLLLVVSLVALGAVVFMTATGGLGKLVGALGSSLSGFVGQITETQRPSSTPLIVADAPVILSPTEPYSNQAAADLQVTVPEVMVGNPAARVRIYLALEGQEPTPIAEVPMGGTLKLIVPVQLMPGRNDFHATIVENGVESEASPIVTFIMDTEPPQFVLTSPQDGETINHQSVTLQGTTQPRTTLLLQNPGTGTSISGQAGSDGTFALEILLTPGPNTVTLSGTDPAGNIGQLNLAVTRGNGQLTSTLSASASRISTSSLPVSIQLGVLVLDPDGQPVSGATITFTLTVPGIPPIAKDAVSGSDGRATFTTTLPAGVTEGAGLATVLVATTDFGSTSAQKTITIVP